MSHDCPRGKHAEPAYVCYRLCKCRCQGCGYLRSEYDSNRNRQQAYGRWQPYVDAEPVREHIRYLASLGVGWKRVAQHAGVSSGAMTKLLYGFGDRPPSKRVRPETARRILSVRPSVIAAGARVDATHTKALVAMLVDNGWTKTAIAARLGVSVGNLLRGDRCTVRIERAIREIVRDEPHPPPECRAQQRGGAYGLAARDAA